MKKQFILIYLTLIVSGLTAQNDVTEQEIKAKLQQTLTDTAQLSKQHFRDTIDEGTVSDLTFYFSENKIVFIQYHRESGGMTSVDDHLYKEFFFIDRSLVFYRFLLKFDEYDKGNLGDSKSSVSERLVFLDEKGKCIKQYKERNAKGTWKTVMAELDKVPLVEDTSLCSENGKKADEYLKRLKE